MRRALRGTTNVTMRLALPLFLAVLRACFAETVELSDNQALEIGRRIWKNECGGTVSGLTSWNAGEEFASLGIAHFIWYPEGKRGPFEESFPKLVAYLGSHWTEVRRLPCRRASRRFASSGRCPR